MKKIILSAVVAAAAIFGGFTASQTGEMAMSDLQLENVEMLAEAEDANSNNHWENVSVQVVMSEKYPGHFVRAEVQQCRVGGSTNCIPTDFRIWEVVI